MFTVIYWGGQIIFFPGWGAVSPLSPPGISAYVLHITQDNYLSMPAREKKHKT